ncbi:MAG: hypothetical protein RL318_1806 [Fibrobacterota bacterium]|jgi:hypothetical protein
MRITLSASLLFISFLGACRKDSPQASPEGSKPDSVQGTEPAIPSPSNATGNALVPDSRTWVFVRTDSSLSVQASGTVIAMESGGATKDDPEPGCESNEVVVPRSLVGGIASWRSSSSGYCEGAAHPWAFSSFRTKILATDSSADLRRIFAESDLLAALRRDGVVKKLSPTPPTSLTDIENLNDSTCIMGFGSGMWTSFAFHHLQGDSVAVRIGLSHGCEVARGSFTQLGILLPVPPAWKEALRAAERSGQLMESLEKKHRD